MADKYFRLVCFVVNICPQPLREFFIKLAKCDAGTSYSNIGAYLSQIHRDMKELKRRRKIRDDQFNLLYPRHGTSDVNKWDVTLLITLITEMFPASLNPMEKFCIDEIRTIRNQLQHLSNTSSMSDKDFDIYWGRLDNASMTLAKQTFSVTSEAGFRKTIDSANTSHLPDLGDALRLWYEETIREMADTINKMNDTINGMKHKLDKIETDTTENTSILRQVTVEKSGHAGDKQKRFKAEDNILVQLQAGFETTVMDLPDSFNAPLEVVDIRRKLRDNHYVVVTGNYNSCYFETALAAIKGMDYNIKRCVEMHTSSDWRHIDPNDVEFVLCRDPFGSFAYDENKAKGMADIFNSMMHTTKGDEKKTLDIVIVTDLTILTECKKYYDHDILEEIVKVFDDTSESRPADLTLGCRKQNVTSNCFPVANNLGVLTSNFLKHYSSQVNESEIKEARDTFKAKKVIVLTGPRKCGKTSVAVALASSYQPSQCSLLTEPRDFKNIDLQNICLIIIDEFAGKYCYDEKNVYKWYSMFDHLYNAIMAGQMNVIITCERSKLDKCCTEILQHPVLQHRVNMPERTTAIKQEMALQHTELVTDPLSQIHGHQSNQSGTQIKSAGNSTGFLQWSATKKDTKYIKYAGDRADCNIVGCCQLPSGDVLLVDQPNMRLKRLDFRYNVISVCDLYDCPWDVCCVSNDTAAIAVFQKLQFVDVREQTLVIIRTVDTDHDCKGLTYHGNKMYVLSGDSIYVYNIYGRKQLTLYTHTSVYSDINQTVVSGDGSKIYIASNREGLVTIDSSGNRLYTFSDPDLLGVCGVCVDDKGNVLACGCWSNDVLKISSDGKQKLGIITEQTSNDIQYTNALTFGKKQFTMLTTGYSNNICVLTLGFSD